MQNYLMHPYQAVVISQGQWTFVTAWYSAYLVVCTSFVFYDLITYFCHSFVCCIYTTKHSFINNVVVMSYFDLVCCLKGVEKKFSERVKYEYDQDHQFSYSVKCIKSLINSLQVGIEKSFFVLYSLRWRRIFNHFLFGWHFMLPKDMPFLVYTLIDFIFSSCMSDCSRRPITNN